MGIGDPEAYIDKKEEEKRICKKEKLWYNKGIQIKIFGHL